jgi:BirA family biotin operon repressor/biotin-[acetyl-CoA-carboxylase] ligase
MFVLADHVEYAREVLPTATTWIPSPSHSRAGPLQTLLEALQPGATWYQSEIEGASFDRALLVDQSSRSQFDTLRELATNNQLPPGNTFCLAGSGRGFHGHRGRGWSALVGNLHVSVALAPRREIPHFGAVFMALPALAAARAIETAVPATRPVAIKWVNDVIVADAKVAGVIAHTRSSSRRIDQAVLGLGLNVQAVPNVARSPFVPRAGALREVDPKVTQHQVLAALIRELGALYSKALEAGAAALLSEYRERSMVIGKNVEIHPDATEGGEIITGRVRAIGDDLQLFLDGRSAPVTRGRLLVTTENNLADTRRNP